jgi:hypothetical protein
MHGPIAHFQRIAPTWLLLELDWGIDPAGRVVQVLRSASNIDSPALGIGCPSFDP